MAESENVIPASKKRAAGKELSRDDPGQDDEEISKQETGTFKRASDEVLATRRFVKVQHKKTTSAPSNPFAGIRLVPPIQEKANVDEPLTDAIDGEKKIGEDCENLKDELDKPSENTKEELEVEKTGVENAKNSIEDGEPEAEKTNAKNVKSIGDDGEPAAELSVDDGVNNIGDPGIMRGEAEAEKTVINEENVKSIGDKFEEKSVVAEKFEGEEDPKGGDSGASEKIEGASNLSSFQQLSSNQNAFTGLAGSGTSSSAFAFGAIPNDGFLSGFSAASNKNGDTFTSMKEVAVETGEENEEAVFQCDSALYEFVEGVWKERGKGEVRVNVSKSSGKARMVMRARGNYRLILNAAVYADMKLGDMEKKGISFACVNCASPETKASLSTFALKFRDASMVEKFRAAVKCS